MTDLDPCLHGCDAALAEADLLIAMLTDDRATLDPELVAVRTRIASLRREIDRLRGMTPVPTRRRLNPDRIDFSGHGSPWGAAQTGPASGVQTGGA